MIIGTTRERRRRNAGRLDREWQFGEVNLKRERKDTLNFTQHFAGNERRREKIRRGELDGGGRQMEDLDLLARAMVWRYV